MLEVIFLSIMTWLVFFSNRKQTSITRPCPQNSQSFQLVQHKAHTAQISTKGQTVLCKLMTSHMYTKTLLYGQQFHAKIIYKHLMFLNRTVTFEYANPDEGCRVMSNANMAVDLVTLRIFKFKFYVRYTKFSASKTMLRLKHRIIHKVTTYLYIILGQYRRQKAAQ